MKAKMYLALVLTIAFFGASQANAQLNPPIQLNPGSCGDFTVTLPAGLSVQIPTTPGLSVTFPQEPSRASTYPAGDMVLSFPNGGSVTFPNTCSPVIAAVPPKRVVVVNGAGAKLASRSNAASRAR